MKIYNDQSQKGLLPELTKLLADFRANRNFDPDKYLEQKCRMLNDYMKDFGLKACAIGISGGIDSAVTLAIIDKASKQKGSPIQKIAPIFLPVFSKEAASNQEETVFKGEELVDKLGHKAVKIDLTLAHSTLKKTVDSSMRVVGAGWASGQLVSYLRTPALYYVTSLLSEMSLPALLCGTTNRDEGAYLGFFGKASDGMVDVQIISDIHKSEVYKLAEILDIPESIAKAIPSGDMYDARPDEEVFGTTYDFVELYQMYLATNSPETKHHLRNGWSKEANEQFELLAGRLESMHSYNKHKYLGKNPSVHFDIYERFVPGGWMD